MKTLFAAVAALALTAAPALAEDPPKGHAQHHHQHQDGAAPGAGMDMSRMTPEEMHKHCAALAGGKMQGAPKHDHAADKLGHAPGAARPTESQMKAMHDRCAAAMKAPKKTSGY